MDSIDNTPLVSVIIPFFNEEKFLAEAIESVIGQSYRNWELLLVDDGSTDESTIMARTYAEKYPAKIRYIEHENHLNKGLSASRNTGVRFSKGDLIAFLDADDIWLSEKIKNQVALISLYPTLGMVAEGSVHWNSWNNPLKKDFNIPVGVTPDKIYEPPQLLYHLYPLGKGSAPGPCSWLLTKAAINRVGGFEESFKEEYQLYEDQAFLCKIYLHEKVYVSSACNNWYRQRPDSIVKWVKEKGHYHKVRQFFLEYLLAYLQKQQIADKKLFRLLRNALLPYHHPTIYFITDSGPRKAWQLSKEAIPSDLKKFIKSLIRK